MLLFVLVACKTNSQLVWLAAGIRQEGHAAHVQYVSSSLASEVDGKLQ